MTGICGDAGYRGTAVEVVTTLTKCVMNIVEKLSSGWCEQHGLPRLDITYVKDIATAELWDDRAVHIRMNTGVRADGH